MTSDEEFAVTLGTAKAAAVGAVRLFLVATVLCAGLTVAGGPGWTWIFAGLFTGAGLLSAGVGYSLHRIIVKCGYGGTS